MKQGCRMHVDGRDHYECMFVLRLLRFGIGYDVYFPPPSPTQSPDDGGWKIMRPSWCEKVSGPGSTAAKKKQQRQNQMQQQKRDQALMPDWGSNDNNAAALSSFESSTGPYGMRSGKGPHHNNNHHHHHHNQESFTTKAI